MTRLVIPRPREDSDWQKFRRWTGLQLLRLAWRVLDKREVTMTTYPPGQSPAELLEKVREVVADWPDGEDPNEPYGECLLCVRDPRGFYLGTAKAAVNAALGEG